MQHFHTDNVGAFVREKEQRFASSTPTKISKHVSFSLKDHIEHVEAYKYSKHISGLTDSMGREKPFFNIGTSASNVWYRATDLDRRNIRVKATTPSTILPAFAATHLLQEFMRREDFGTFLNKWGRVLVDYGSAVTKFIEKDGKLHAMVVPWNRIIIDPISFDNDVTIEIVYMTPDQLLMNDAYDKDQVKQLIDAKETRKDSDNNQKDTKNNFIKVYEVHGKMPKSFRTGKPEDAYEYEQQMYAVSFVSRDKGKAYDDFILVSGREDKHPYMITHLIEEEGRSMGIGAYEHIFEAQWMVNHTAKSIKDQLDLASKLIFQTADDTFMGQNALQAMETGDILIHANNSPVTQLQNNSHDVSALQSYGEQWRAVANEITGVSEAMKGVTPPSGTAWRQTAAVLQESHSLFELMTESKGLGLERMLRTHVLPWIKKQMNTTKELSVILDGAGIKTIDSRFIPYEAEKRTKQAVKKVLLEQGVDGLAQIDPAQSEMDVKKELELLGNQRFLKPSEIEGETWAKALKDLEWDLEVEITNENTDKEATLTTLTTVLQTIAGNPAMLQDPNISMLFNKILEETGRISPIELSQSQAAPQQPQQAAPQAPPMQQMAPQPPT